VKLWKDVFEKSEKMEKEDVARDNQKARELSQQRWYNSNLNLSNLEMSLLQYLISLI